MAQEENQMKFWAKINRGLVLTILALFAVVVYLIVLQVSHNAARPEIESICKSYVKTAVNYSMLPQKYRKASPAMPQSELDSYLSDMQNDIKAFYPDNEQTYKYVINQYTASLENQAKGINMVYSYTKDVSSFSGLNFNGSTVIVSIVTDTNYTGAAVNTGSTVTGAGSDTFTPVSGQTTDTITLQKIDGKWMVVYADLQQPAQGGSSYVK